MNMYLWVALGGAIGASGRFFTTSMTGRLIGHGFPWGTMTVNVVGSFIMGALISFMAIKWSTSTEMRAFLTTGILGGIATVCPWHTRPSCWKPQNGRLSRCAGAGRRGAASVCVSRGMRTMASRSFRHHAANAERAGRRCQRKNLDGNNRCNETV